MLRFIPIFLVCSVLNFNLLKADTLTVMHYNLMYYDHIYDDCNAETNNVHLKNINLATILQFVHPDILTVNEVASQLTSVNMIKDSTLNVDGVTKYARANMVSETYMTNMVYYNTEKLSLVSQEYVNTSPRKTQFYHFELLNTFDDVANGPISLTCGVTHLKAGSYADNVSAREQAATAIMGYIDYNSIGGNVLFSGDLNLYRASEPAFQLFISPTANTSFRFYDPLNRIGEWGSNSSYRDIHTQSTRSAEASCFSSGGMDDRFDFILASSNIIDGAEGLIFKKYITLGQDGKRYNQSLISPANSTLPSAVLNALYNMSDHLPVIMKLTYDKTTAVKPKVTDRPRFNNPVSEMLHISADGPIINVNVFSAIGRLMLSDRLSQQSHIYSCNLSTLTSGIFLVEITMCNGTRQTIKVVKL